MRDLEGGKERRVTFEEYLELWGVAWTGDGRELIYSAGRNSGAAMRLFRVGFSGDEPQAVYFAGRAAVDPHARGNLLTYVQHQWTMSDIWRIPGPESGSKLEPERVIRTNPVFEDTAARVSPVGDRILFTSDRTDAIEVWMSGSVPVTGTAQSI